MQWLTLSGAGAGLGQCHQVPMVVSCLIYALEGYTTILAVSVYMTQ
jgi:hypothetical protein